MRWRGCVTYSCQILLSQGAGEAGSDDHLQLGLLSLISSEYLQRLVSSTPTRVRGDSSCSDVLDGEDNSKP